MAYFLIERVVGLPVEEAWRRLTDWERHADHMPLTTVTRTTPPPAGPGAVFVARTGVGPLAFDDPMEVVVWEPPGTCGPAGRCRVEKRGSFITGWAEIDVRPHGPRPAEASRVVWREELRVRWLPGPLDGLAGRVSRLLFARTVSGLLAARPPRRGAAAP